MHFAWSLIQFYSEGAAFGEELHWVMLPGRSSVNKSWRCHSWDTDNSGRAHCLALSAYRLTASSVLQHRQPSFSRRQAKGVAQPWTVNFQTPTQINSLFPKKQLWGTLVKVAESWLITPSMPGLVSAGNTGHWKAPYFFISVCEPTCP